MWVAVQVDPVDVVAVPLVAAGAGEGVEGLTKGLNESNK